MVTNRRTSSTRSGLKGWVNLVNRLLSPWNASRLISEVCSSSSRCGSSVITQMAGVDVGWCDVWLAVSAWLRRTTFPSSPFIVISSSS